jgi:galactose mutarotase-like enzyme
MTDSQTWIPLESAELHAEINPLGAQLSVLRDRDGLDLLWDGNPSIWSGRAPILFPIVGELAGGKYRLAGEIYHLSRHGFARGKRFEVVASTTTTALFRLKADESTLPIYPFQFELDVRFAIAGATLTLATSVRNIGDSPMPASFGYHPAFRWPLPYGRERAGHFIEFTNDEPAPIRRLNAIGLLRPETYPTPIAHRRLMLEDALFDQDAIIFDQVRSRSVSYGAASGPRIRVGYPDSPYLGVWTKPGGAPFICIEPWHGLADPERFSGELAAKPGVFTVAPGGTQSIEMTITLLKD